MNRNYLEKILSLHESGKSISDILDLFPENKGEIKEFFQAIEVLEKQGKKIIPPKQLLEKIVTQTELDSYLYRRENVKNKGRIINQIHEFMSLKWKIGIPAGIIIIALGVFAYNQLNVIAPDSTQKMVEIPEVDTPKITANIDNAVDAILLSVSEEQAIFESELNDAALLEMDDELLSDFGQIYDENLF